jgi:hypothetical protein
MAGAPRDVSVAARAVVAVACAYRDQPRWNLFLSAESRALGWRRMLQRTVWQVNMAGEKPTVSVAARSRSSSSSSAVNNRSASRGCCRCSSSGGDKACASKGRGIVQQCTTRFSTRESARAAGGERGAMLQVLVQRARLTRTHTSSPAAPPPPLHSHPLHTCITASLVPPPASRMLVTSNASSNLPLPSLPLTSTHTLPLAPTTPPIHIPLPPA